MTKAKEATLRKIVVDSGKYATKAIEVTETGEFNRLKFRTKMSETEESITNASETYAIEMNGERYLIGKLANESDWETSKASDLHRLSIYTAIHHFVSDGDEISLAVGCPLSVYTKRKHREEYEQYIQGNEAITITVNGVKKTFRIIEINALPETSGYLFKNIEEYEDKMFSIVDIGGLNANCCQYNGIDIVTESDLTLIFGMNTLYTKIRNELNKEFSANITILQVEQFMNRDKKDWFIRKDKENSNRLVRKIALEHVREIHSELKQNGWDTDNMEFIFVGGGSLILKDEIQQVFGEDVVISDTGVWDNAEGFGTLL
jgi:Actin like proteins N terminal domain